MSTLVAVPGLSDSFITDLNANFAAVSGGLSVVAFGAKGDGVADDTQAFQSAIAAGVGKEIIVPSGNYLIKQTLDLSGGQLLVGGGRYNTFITCKIDGVDVVSLSSDGSGIVGIGIIATVQRTAGKYIKVLNATRYNRIEDVLMVAPFIGIHFGAAGPVICNITDVYMQASSPSTATGVLIEGGNELFFKNVVITGAPGSLMNYGFRLKNTGGVYLTDCATIHCVYGGMIDPGTSQAVQWCQFLDTAFDTGTFGFVVQPGAGGSVTGGVFSGLWGSTNTHQGLYVGGGAGTVDGFSFHNSRLLNNGLEGALIDAGSTNVSLVGGFVAGNSTTTPNAKSGILVKANVNKFSIVGVTSGASLGFTAIQKYGVEIEGGTGANYTVVGNNLSDNHSAGISNFAAGMGSVNSNVGAKDQITVTVSASPFTYTATQDGALYLVGGTVSNLAIVRNGVTFDVVYTTGVMPMTAGDEAVVVYSGLPALTFMPS